MAGHFNLLIDAGWKLREIGDRYGLSAALVHRIAHGQIDYSAPAVLGVLDIPTVEVRAVVRLAPGAPPPPPILFLDATGAQATAPGLSLPEVAELAGCVLRTVQRYVERGAIPIVELVPGRPKSHRLARVPEHEARAWAAWYRAKEAKRGGNP